MASILIQDLFKTYGQFVAVQNFTLAVDDGEFVSILGPSGCGKTTLLRSIAGFFPVTLGTIQIGDREVASSQNRIHIAPEDRNIGMVFQSYAVWPHMTVFANVAYPLKIRNVSQDQMKHKVASVLSMLTLDGQEEKYPSHLSGGQQQRVALGRALVMDPDVLLLDEPLSNLDSKLRERMRFELKEIQRKLNLTIIYVTHDQDEAMAVSDRIVLMNQGRIQQQDDPRTLYSSPANLFCARFMGRSNVISGIAVSGARGTATLQTEAGVDVPVSVADGCRVEAHAQVTGVIRYEDVEIVADSVADTIPARVIVETYFGSYSLYELDTPVGVMIARSDGEPSYPENSQVFVRFPRVFIYPDSDEQD